MNYVVDDIGVVVAAMRPIDNLYSQTMLDYMSNNAANTDLSLAPFYMYGHRREISNRLLEKDKDEVYMYQKYPLIALRMDIAETISNGVYSYSLNLAILNFTDKNWNAEERMTNIFKPVLYPLYERFMSELQNSGLFMWTGNQDYPEHTKIDRPFWGTDSQEGNVKNIFNDPIDAIEIIGLKLNSTRKSNC